MIKINLALKKQSGLIADSKTLGKGFTSQFSLNRLDQYKDLPIRKLAVPLVVCFIGSYLLDSYKDDELKKLEQNLAGTMAKNQALQVRLKSFSSYESIEKDLDSDEKTIRTKLDIIKKLVNSHSPPSKLLISIAKTIPKDVWLSEFSLDHQKMVIKGSALKLDQVSDFMKELNQNAFFSKVDLKNSQQNKNDSGTELANFELGATLK